MKWVAPVGSTVLLDAVTSYVAIVVSTKSHSLFRLLGPEPLSRQSCIPNNRAFQIIQPSVMMIPSPDHPAAQRALNSVFLEMMHAAAMFDYHLRDQSMIMSVATVQE